MFCIKLICYKLLKAYSQRNTALLSYVPADNKDWQEVSPLSVLVITCPIYHMNVAPLDHLFQLLYSDVCRNCALVLVFSWRCQEVVYSFVIGIHQM
jgi:hypothetical protein